MSRKKECKYCHAAMKKDWVALNRKLYDPDIKEFMCLECMAEELSCTVDDLEVKIQEFKEQGCTLF